MIAGLSFEYAHARVAAESVAGQRAQVRTLWQAVFGED